MDSEAQLIRRIAQAIPCHVGGKRTLRLGIGDDAAIVSPPGDADWILSCDAFLEGVHFLANAHPAASVGYKALTRAASDLVAMGAMPGMFLLTLALPSHRTGAWLNEFLRGMGNAARLLGMQLIGGDTTKNPTVAISITVIGNAQRGRAITRSGAKPGDILHVTGKLGQAQLGLALIQSGLQGSATAQRLMQPHLYPCIRPDLGVWLARKRAASAMIDISDGLSSDLAHLCASSGVGARLWAGRIPCVRIPAALTSKLANLGLNPLQMALHGGEDYALLFSVSPRKAKVLRQPPGFGEITAIGEITRDKRLLLVSPDGREKHLVPRGWDPFRRPASKPSR